MQYFNLHRHSPAKDLEENAIINRFPADAPLENNLYSVGLHPWHVSENTLDLDLRLVTSKGKNAAAIGECGLDRACNVPFELQCEAFRAQIGIAMKLGKPLLIHCVRSYPEIISEKNRFGEIVPWIIHGFRGNHETALQLVKHGFHLSFGNAILNDASLCDVLKSLPLDNLFLETDDQDMDVKDVYAKAASSRGMAVDLLCSAVRSNARMTFDL